MGGVSEYTGNILIVVFVGLAAATIAFIPTIFVWMRDQHVPESVVAWSK